MGGPNMRMGISLGLGTAFWRVLKGASFAADPGGAGAFTLPAWLAIVCSSTGRTSQISASAIRTGFGANAARARSADGTHWGLSVEKQNSNVSPKSQTIDTWTHFSTTYTADTHVAPDGMTTADTLAWAANNRYATPGGSGSGNACLSIWARTATTGTQVRILDGIGATATKTLSLTSAWQRGDLAANFTSVDLGVGTFTTNIPNGDAAVWGGQLESGLYPTSYIPTTSGTVTRNADVLSIPTPAGISPNGFVDVDLTWVPHYAQSEQGVDHDLLFFDSSNRLYVQQSTSKIILRVGGSNVLSSALTWSRNQALRIRAQHRSNGRTLVVSGATTGDGTTTGGAQSAISLPGTAYLLGNASGGQECSDLRSILFMRAA